MVVADPVQGLDFPLPAECIGDERGGSACGVQAGHTEDRDVGQGCAGQVGDGALRFLSAIGPAMLRRILRRQSGVRSPPRRSAGVGISRPFRSRSPSARRDETLPILMPRPARRSLRPPCAKERHLRIGCLCHLTRRLTAASLRASSTRPSCSYSSRAGRTAREGGNTLPPARRRGPARSPAPTASHTLRRCGAGSPSRRTAPARPPRQHRIRSSASAHDAAPPQTTSGRWRTPKRLARAPSLPVVVALWLGQRCTGPDRDDDVADCLAGCGGVALAFHQ